MPLPERIEAKVHKQAGKIVDRLLNAKEKRHKGASVKSLTLAPNIIAKKATHAIVCETLKYRAVIREIFADAELENLHQKLSSGLLYVLGYEVIFGQGCRPVSEPEKLILKYQAPLKAALKTKMQRANVKEVSALLPEAVLEVSALASALPRYVRVNTLKTQTTLALNTLQKRFQAHEDEHVESLVVLPPGSDLHRHPLLLQGALVLQGKGSCMPAAVLDPKPGWEVVDACAAPGNKTTHLAALMQNRGVVHAFDADKRRLKRLRANASLTGASCINPTRADFLSLDPAQYPRVRGLVVDPSCSGSGTSLVRGDVLIQHAADNNNQEEGEKEGEEGRQDRIARLAAFQESAVKHALKFPGAHRVVYSTCSLEQRENEGVVAAVLQAPEARGWELHKALPAWPRRGETSSALGEQAHLVVRVDPAEDHAEGFFLALFTRAEQNIPPTHSSSGEIVSTSRNSKDTEVDTKWSSKKRKNTSIADEVSIVGTSQSVSVASLTRNRPKSGGSNSRKKKRPII